MIEIKQYLNILITEFETCRNRCHDDAYQQHKKQHEEYLASGSGAVTPPTPRKAMRCETDCPTEYGTLTCWCIPHIYSYYTAKELLNIITQVEKP